MAEASGSGPPRLEELILNHTGIDDEAAPYLSCCSSLSSLRLVGTRITSQFCPFKLFNSDMFFLEALGFSLLSTHAHGSNSSISLAAEVSRLRNDGDSSRYSSELGCIVI